MLAITRAESTLRALAPARLPSSGRISAPFTLALTKLANAIVRLFGVRPDQLEEQHTEEDVKAIIRQSATGGIARPRRRR